MRKSIFQLNNKMTYKDEYLKIIKVLSSKCVTYEKKNYSYFEFVNTYLFQNWKYRSTYLDLYEYLSFIGVSISNKKIREEEFINFIEFLLNMQLLLESMKKYKDKVYFDTTCQSILFHNIPIILENLNYQAYDLDDRVLIFKKDICYEDLFEIVPDDIYELLLSYNSYNNSGIKIKRIILNKLYNYLLLDIDTYKSFNNSLVVSIKFIITKLGVIGDIDSKYKNITNYKLRKYYDECFTMIEYLIQTKLIVKYKDEIFSLKKGS